MQTLGTKQPKQLATLQLVTMNSMQHAGKVTGDDKAVWKIISPIHSLISLGITIKLYTA